MRSLTLAIKTQISATLNLSPLIGRTFFAVVGDSIKLADGPYARVTVVNNDATYAFSDNTGWDQTQIQISVFAEQLNVADDLVDKLITAFQGSALVLTTGGKAYGLRLSRGAMSEPKSPDSNQTFHAFVVFQFLYEGA